MRRAVVTVVSLAFAVAVTAAVTARAGGGDDADGKGAVLTVIEHATTDTTTDTGAQGDTAGDLLTFANDVFDSTDTRKVGTDQGYCVRIVPGVSYECNWTTSLAGGQITAEGPFLDAGDSTLAITGGTGRYADASGFLNLHALENGTKFSFEFHLLD